MLSITCLFLVENDLVESVRQHKSDIHSRKAGGKSLLPAWYNLTIEFAAQRVVLIPHQIPAWYNQPRSTTTTSWSSYPIRHPHGIMNGDGDITPDESSYPTRYQHGIIRKSRMSSSVKVLIPHQNKPKEPNRAPVWF